MNLLFAGPWWGRTEFWLKSNSNIRGLWFMVYLSLLCACPWDGARVHLHDLVEMLRETSCMHGTCSSVFHMWGDVHSSAGHTTNSSLFRLTSSCSIDHSQRHFFQCGVEVFCHFLKQLDSWRKSCRLLSQLSFNLNTKISVISYLKADCILFPKGKFILDQTLFRPKGTIDGFSSSNKRYVAQTKVPVDIRKE